MSYAQGARLVLPLDPRASIAGAVFVAIVSLVIFRSPKYWKFAWIPVFYYFNPLWAPGYFLIFLFTQAAGAAFAVWRPSLTVLSLFYPSALLASSILVGDIFYYAYQDKATKWVHSIRNAFPVIDLRARLSSGKLSSCDKQIDQPVPTARRDEGWESFLSEHYSGSSGLNSLQVLYSSSYEEYLRSGRGHYGQAEFARTWKKYTFFLEDIPVTSPLFAPEADKLNFHYLHPELKRMAREFGIFLGLDSEEKILRWSYLDFLYSGSFGYSLDRKQSAGFSVHAFHVPFPVFVQGEVYKLQSIGLILCQGDQLVVQQNGDFLPRLDKKPGDPDFVTRSLNEFEDSGLSELKNGKWIVTERGTDRIQILGALRAGKSCLVCHDGNEMDLLGVLSYEFKAIE